VDKAIFMTPKTTKLLKSRTSQLIHFTPDMAFYSNASRYFNKSIINYDYVVTTKSKEVEIYEGIVNKDKIIVVTQGFDKQIHKPYHTFEEKDNAIVFIGLAEPSRLEIAEQIINNNIRLKLVGKGWKGFVEKHRSNQNFNYYGDAVYNEEYGRLISSSKFALGLLSKRFPEFHTTRTLEIPACGTALLTESNIETASLFSKNDVIFYDNYEDIIKKIKYFLNNQDLLQKIMTNGHEKVIKKGYDYESILQSILERIKE
jgi:spore maturation protein CgeB